MLTVRNTEAIRQIEAAIGYTFHDKRLLVQVLTRKTYLKIDPKPPTTRCWSSTATPS